MKFNSHRQHDLLPTETLLRDALQRSLRDAAMARRSPFGARRLRPRLVMLLAYACAQQLRELRILQVLLREFTRSLHIEQAHATAERPQVVPVRCCGSIGSDAAVVGHRPVNDLVGHDGKIVCDDAILVLAPALDTETESGGAWRRSGARHVRASSRRAAAARALEVRRMETRGERRHAGWELARAGLTARWRRRGRSLVLEGEQRVAIWREHDRV